MTLSAKRSYKQEEVFTRRTPRDLVPIFGGATTLAQTLLPSPTCTPDSGSSAPPSRWKFRPSIRDIKRKNLLGGRPGISSRSSLARRRLIRFVAVVWTVAHLDPRLGSSAPPSRSSFSPSVHDVRRKHLLRGHLGISCRSMLARQRRICVVAGAGAVARHEPRLAIFCPSKPMELSANRTSYRGEAFTRRTVRDLVPIVAVATTPDSGCRCSFAVAHLDRRFGISCPTKPIELSAKRS
jgi:hypothetical protein